MNTLKKLAVCAGLVSLLSGCGAETGLLIKPVPVDERLREKVVRSDPGWVTAKVALIDVDGLIVNRRSSPLFSSGENPVSLLAEKLDAAGRDPAVKAVLLRINSPGGTVQASEVMYDLVRRFQQRTGKPVIACITDVGASGAYYVACAARRILCQPSSITGSIGVIVQTVSFAGTMRKLGVSAEAITSGPMKDMGSPLKPLGAQERKLFQNMVNEFYERFVEVVARGRKDLSVEQVRKLADGRVYTGTQALKAGLVDALGTLPDAVEAAKKAAGVRKAKVVMYHRPLGYRANVYSALPAALPAMQVNLVNLQLNGMLLLRRPSFLYLWSTDLKPPGAGPWR